MAKISTILTFRNVALFSKSLTMASQSTQKIASTGSTFLISCSERTRPWLQMARLCKTCPNHTKIPMLKLNITTYCRQSLTCLNGPNVALWTSKLKGLPGCLSFTPVIRLLFSKIPTKKTRRRHSRPAGRPLSPEELRKRPNQGWSLLRSRRWNRASHWQRRNKIFSRKRENAWGRRTKKKFCKPQKIKRNQRLLQQKLIPKKPASLTPKPKLYKKLKMKMKNLKDPCQSPQTT